MATKRKQPQQSAPEPIAEETQTCETLEKPVFAASFHLPKTSWHEHRDWGGSVEDDTEFQAFAAITMKLLMELTGGNNRLVIGFLGDMLNTLPKNLRLAMMHVIGNGLGLNIQAATDDLNTIDVSLVPRYEVLTPSLPDPSKQLVTPGGASAGAVQVSPELLEKIRQQQRGP